MGRLVRKINQCGSYVDMNPSRDSHETKTQFQINFKIKLGHRDSKDVLIPFLKLLTPNPIQSQCEILFLTLSVRKKNTLNLCHYLSSSV